MEIPIATTDNFVRKLNLLEMERKTGIWLSDEDAELVKIFLRYRNIWERIFSRDNKNTEITLFFNNDGELRIAKELKTFKN